LRGSLYRSIRYLRRSHTVRIEDVTTIDGDPAAIRRLLENLFSNTVEYGSENVTVRLGRISDGYYVEDDRPGIPENVRDEIFARDIRRKTVGAVSVR